MTNECCVCKKIRRFFGIILVILILYHIALGRRLRRRQGIPGENSDRNGF